MLKVKNREYKTIKWEKRKDQILAYEKMYKAQVEELKKSLNSEVSSNAEQWCLLKLSYASIFELDYINKREEAFKEHLKDLLQNASLCCKAYNDGVDMHEATRRPIAEGLKSGFEGYYALIAQDEDVLMNVTNEEHPLRKLLEHKKIPTETDKYDELCDMINAIVENDSDAFNEALSARIRSIRKMPTDYFICLDVWSMGLIRYAEKQGMIVDRDKYIETDLSSIGL